MVQTKSLLKIFHASVAVLNSSAILYDQLYIDIPFPSKDIEALPCKARFIFLTVWCLVLQIIYFSVSFLNDVYGTDSLTPKNPPLIRRIRDVLFCLSFTVAIYVAMVFWAMYAVHKDLIFPHEIESRIPPWVNHVMHTLIIPFIVIELLVTKRQYPSRKFGVKLITYFIVAYSLFVLFLYVMTGVWVYPFLKYFNWTMRFVFCFISTVVGLGLYVLGEKLNSLVYPSTKSYANGVNGHSKRH